MMRIRRWLFLSNAVLFGACASAPTMEQEQVGATARATKQGSCEGACGDRSPDGCWCDDKCHDEGDCCADKRVVCDGQVASCRGACGDRSPDGCWCDDKCASYGDCCPDMNMECPTPLTAGSCAGRCGGEGSEGCWCDERCEREGDCCSDYVPLCVLDGMVGEDVANALVFGPEGGPPRFSGEDFTGRSVQYSYRRLTDAHPECVERTADGGSVVRVVLETWYTQGRDDDTRTNYRETMFVSGFSTTPTVEVPIRKSLQLLSGKNLHLRFRCGAAPGFDAAYDGPEHGYVVYIIR